VPQHREDFGQTLGVWGVGDGPYMVLPVLGPSNLRDTTGMITDRVAFSLIDPFGASSFQTEYPPVLALNAINARDRIEFRYYQTGSPFEYDLVRFFYTKKRELDIAN
jgi:phospholipid-binding lipoprotein MlaA